MWRIVIRRLLALAPLLLAVALGAFLLVRLAPGDFLSELSLNPQVSPETVAAMRERYGLDLPWYEQFGRWLSRALRGDLGYSLACHCDVAGQIAVHVFQTTVLAAAGLGLALAVALPLGVWSVWKRSRMLDRAITAGVSILLAWPTFLWALGALLLAAGTGWFPIGGISSIENERYSTAEKFIDLLHHLALPAAVVALKQAPHYLQTLRASLAEAMLEDHIRAARARGVPESRLLVRHALRNAINPLLTMFGQGVGALLSGTFIVETVLSWPGIGSLAVGSLLARDLDMLVACLLYAAILLAMGNLLADLMLAAADPRIRRPQRG
jgi:peptide/nickel transport system permease protein